MNVWFLTGDDFAAVTEDHSGAAFSSADCSIIREIEMTMNDVKHTYTDYIMS